MFFQYMLSAFCGVVICKQNDCVYNNITVMLSTRGKFCIIESSWKKHRVPMFANTGMCQ